MFSEPGGLEQRMGHKEQERARITRGLGWPAKRQRLGPKGNEEATELRGFAGGAGTGRCADSGGAVAGIQIRDELRQP